MSERGKITLQQMQDECKRVLKIEGVCPQCKYVDVCVARKGTDWTKLDLTDPPRFNEAQMALLKALREIGVDSITSNNYGFTVASLAKFITMSSLLGMKLGETLDLAELLGKDGV